MIHRRRPPYRAVPIGGGPNLDIDCQPERMSVGADTRKPFAGRVYAKNADVDEAGCLARGDGKSKRAEIEFGLDQCGTTRRRSRNPPGVFYENTVMFSFHRKFVTKVDQAYKVSCFYMEAVKDVTVPLDVSKLTTQHHEGQLPMPTCDYTIHLDSVDGPPVRYATAGQTVFHKWHCDTSESGDVFKMKVVGCTLTDDAGNTLELIDANGCAVDESLLPDLEYTVTDDGGLRAAVESSAFKFPDRETENFQCEIELCVDFEGGCENVVGGRSTLCRVIRYHWGNDKLPCPYSAVESFCNAPSIRLLGDIRTVVVSNRCQ